jgi:2-polyprenyl-3-methyl-5-hydroxy-6-metoxy-1,4-benzoquinol methylase
MKLLYEIIYRIMRIFQVPYAWVFGDKQALVDELLEEGRIVPCRAIDLGCWAGVEVVYLATEGFQVTSVEYSPTAVKLAREEARTAGGSMAFIQSDLTDLRHMPERSTCFWNSARWTI